MVFTSLHPGFLAFRLPLPGALGAPWLPASLSWAAAICFIGKLSMDWFEGILQETMVFTIKLIRFSG
jgi:hypothetical protein